VFLGGNQLPQRWQGRHRFVVLETGFGLGHNFLATWAAWRSDPMRCTTLWFVSIDRHPPQRDDLRRAHGAPAAGPAAELIESWPPLLPGLHLVDFEGARVRLLLAFGDVHTMLRELVLQADAVYLDGFAPDRNPAMWDRHLWPLLARRCAAGSTAATWSAAHGVRDGLTSAGWAVERASGFGAKREMTVARFEPRFFPPAPPGRLPAAVRSGSPMALIIGAGLAGAAAASALARAGWGCTVIDSASAPANGASGNPAGVFHGLVQGANGPHARLLRAAAGFLARSLPAQGFEGSFAGLLRVADDAQASADTLAQRSTRALGFELPPDWARPLDADSAAARCDVPLHHPAWLALTGGWLAPAAWVRRTLAQSGVTVMLNADVAAIRRIGSRWHAIGASGCALADADVLVLANAADAARLAGARAMPVMASVRGQVTLLPGAAIDARPTLPLAGSGTLIPLPDGRLLVGATWHPGDDDTSVRAQDHAHNLAQMQRLLGCTTGPDADPSSLSGRVAFRCATADRLPIVGPLPAADATAHDQVRHIVRAEGLYALTALGSRGIALAPLAGEILASWITGAPMPVEASLLDAIDPARARRNLGDRPSAASSVLD
jgi:tRNA 5-methylaminomethyl-2-thiouridine biosynthesis bifunctional protein